MSAATQTHTEEEHEQRVERQAFAEQYRNLLLVGPVPARMVEDWAQRMTRPHVLTAFDIEAHFRPLCSPYTFGRWAHAAYVIRNGDVPECVTEIIRNTHLQADASQQLVGTLELFNPRRIAPMTQLAELHRASHTTPSMYETVARIVLPPNATMSAKTSALIRRGCDALRQHGMTQAADTMWRHHEALLNNEISGKPKAQNNKSRPKTANSPQSPPSKPASKTNLTPKVSAHTAAPAIKNSAPMAAVIVLSSAELLMLSEFVATSRHVQLDVDARYLAAELTQHYRWMLVCPEAIRLPVGHDTMSFEGIEVVVDEEAITVIFHVNGKSRRQPRTVITRRGIHRAAYGSLALTAQAVLALLFGATQRLRTASGRSEVSVAKRFASKLGTEAVAVYRFTGHFQWTDRIKFVRAVKRSTTKKAAASRKAHEVRGHVRRLKGQKVRVRPHRRKS